MNTRAIRFSILIIAAGAILLLYFFVEPKDGNLPKCFFNQLTGYYCPGCGVQRSFHSLLHGNVLSAMSFNLLFVLMLPLIFYFLYQFLMGKKYTPGSFIYNKKFSIAIAALFICFWLLRNIPASPFSWLAP
jgi:Ca2+/Na+ antiporter